VNGLDDEQYVGAETWLGIQDEAEIDFFEKLKSEL